MNAADESTPAPATTDTAIDPARSAISERWVIPLVVLDKLPALALRIATSDTARPREKLQAMKLLVAMHGQNQNADVEENRIERLDTGKPTEIIEFGAIELRSVPAV